MEIYKYMVPREKLVILRPGDTIQTATEKMSKNNVGSVLIEADNEIKGIVTAQDIFRLIADKKSAALSKPMEQIMSRKLVTINSEEFTSDAIAKMKDSKLHHLLVTDEDENVIGIISSFDLIREQALDNHAHPWIRK